MVVKSHGGRKRTRGKFRNPGRLTVNDFLREYSAGQKVALVVNSSSQKGMPFRRFHGLTGTVLEKRGRGFVVEIFDGNKKKIVTAKPEHLKALN
ncbi:MAG TPA: 50S ribosomal protein L21e [archaeon]|nr:50S ribosomal protein L21e [archaeon]